MKKNQESLELRPYQLMCIVCKIGVGWTGDAQSGKLYTVLKVIRRNPNISVTLRCNVDSAYAYQNPGRVDDTPEGDLFNEKRDLDILHKLGLVPGATRPALELFERLLKDVTTTQGICGYADITSDKWRGCSDVGSGNYKKGRAKGIHSIIPPRSKNEKAISKKESVESMYRAKTLLIRPHHLMCMACFHGREKTLKPIAEDNLFEAINIIQNDPDMPIVLTRGCCMICPPCSRYDAKAGLCIGANGMSLRDQKKDLDVLHLLGLSYGDTLPARRLYALLFERVHSTKQICGYGDGVVRGHEWTICGDPEGNDAYVKARESNMEI